MVGLRHRRLDCEVRHAVFYLVISGCQHQVSGKTLRIQTKHNVFPGLPLDPYALTNSWSLRKPALRKQIVERPRHTTPVMMDNDAPVGDVA